MANFVANSQFSIDAIDLGFYVDNISDGGFEEDSNLSFFGTIYPDHFYVIAESGNQHLRLDIYGQNITVSAFGTITGGTINAVGEYDLNSSTQRWYASGFSADAAATFSAALSASSSDDIAVIQNALSGADTIALSPFADTMGGYGGDDSIKGGGGNDTLDGGAGTDTAILDATFAQASVSFDGNILVISSAVDGVDRLANFEFVSFGGDVRSVVSLLPPNDPPVPIAATATATEDGGVVTGQLQATDQQSDPLVFALTGGNIPGLTISPNGNYSFNPSVSAYQALGAGQNQQIVATFSVSDGRASATSTLTITVTGANDAPSFALAQRSLDTLVGQQVEFVVSATDPDGDQIAYSSTVAAHGTVSLTSAGAFIYTPADGFTGTDTFSIQASDGQGGSAAQSFIVNVIAPNANPVISPTGVQISTTVGIPKEFTVNATDPDGDTLVYSAADPNHGSVTGGPNGLFTYTPDVGFTGVDSILVTVSDGRGGSATQNYSVAVSLDNSPPVIEPFGLSFSTTIDTVKAFVVSASDPDGDPLSYAISGPLNGLVSGGADGEFLYTPNPGFSGIDTFTVTVSDGRGGSDVETFTVSVAGAMPLQRDFTLLASGGFVGTVGGYGNVFGTSINEQVTILNRPGAVTFDPSFNKGGDVVYLSGDASEWQISRAGSTAVLTDGDTFVEIPTGTTGTAVVFDDGIRVLKIDVQVGALKIGSQAFDETNVQITAPAQNIELQGGADTEAFANLLMQPGGHVVAGGVLNVFGTSSGHEAVELLFGEISFDPSFNKGGDLLIMSGPATAFTAGVAGSTVFLNNNELAVGIPAGVIGVEVEFTPDDVRTIVIDQIVGGIKLGEQLLGTEPIMLSLV